MWAVRLDGHLLCGGPLLQGFQDGAGMLWFDPARLDLPPLAAPGGIVARDDPAPARRLEDRREARTPSRSPRRVVLEVKLTNAPDWATEAPVTEQWAECGVFTAVDIIRRQDGHCAGNLFLTLSSGRSLRQALA